MATNQFKKIGDKDKSAEDTRKHNNSIMMPFIKFGFGAIKVIGHALIYIVKSLPVLFEHTPKTKPTNRVIKF